MTRKQAIRIVERRVFTEASLGSGRDQDGAPNIAIADGLAKVVGLTLRLKL
jgi:hypothetical protein